VSTLSSLIEAAAAGISQAAGNAPASLSQTFDPTGAAAPSCGAPKDAGVVFPKFDQHTQATLLAYQEMHCGA
jgi:hypothetical protein